MIVEFRSFLFAALPLLVSVAVVAAAEGEKKPAPPVDGQRIAALITQLAADDYFLREKAQVELGEIGAEAFDALSDAADKTRDVETAERVAYLLRTIRIVWAPATDPDLVRSKLQVYESLDDEGRRAVITDLANIPDAQPLPALCRIVRYERSQMLSKWAAIRIMEQKEPASADAQARAAALRAGLEGCPRPAAAWVRAYLLAQTDPAGGVAELQKLSEAEEQVLRQYPHRTRPDIVMSLLRRVSDLYKQLDRPQESAAALVRMISLDADSSEMLIEVIQMLIDRQAWGELDQAAARFYDRIVEDPITAYAVAEGYRRQGKQHEADRFAKAAAALNPDDQRRHIITALELARQGYTHWSDVEYRRSIEMGQPGERDTLTAQVLLGESLHDRRLDLDAARVLDDASEGMKAALARGQDMSEAPRTLEANRARAHYFHAAHQQQAGDPKEEVRHLLEGLGEDTHDAEILIALYRVQELDDSVRIRVKKLIAESAEMYRVQINTSPEDDTPYNQLAWLISNTEGDFQEALRASQKSLEIKPENPGHLDTLGRCYFALGDYANAVKTQSRAVELEPHSQQMKRQLAEFQAALEKRKSNK